MKIYTHKKIFCSLVNSISLYWLPSFGYVIFPELIKRMKPEIHMPVHMTMTSEANHGMNSILMFLITIIEAVFKTAIAIAMFFHRQQSARKNMTPSP